jgi:GT2 family glycosyltransferase
MNHKFSVIIPSHNEGDWLKTTVMGVLENTTYPDFEIIVVADGCTDTSCDFLRNGVPNVKLVSLEKSVGAAKARNEGAKVAEGEYFVFLDSHMIPTDESWLTELALQLENETVGAATLKIPYLEEENRVAYVYTIKDWLLEPTWVSPTSKTEVQPVPAIPGACFGIRRTMFEKTGGFDTGLMKWGREDLEYSLRLWRMGYDLTMSPRAGIAHSWERKRTFEISWNEVDYNILRTALTLLSPDYADKVVAHLKTIRPKHVTQYLHLLKQDEGFQTRKEKLSQTFKRSFHDYISTFSNGLPVLQKNS